MGVSNPVPAHYGDGGAGENTDTHLPGYSGGTSGLRLLELPWRAARISLHAVCGSGLQDRRVPACPRPGRRRMPQQKKGGERRCLLVHDRVGEAQDELLSRDRVGGADYPRGFPAPPPRRQGSGEGWPREGWVTAYRQDRGAGPASAWSLREQLRILPSMADLSTWLPWSVVLAVVLYVWRRLDARMDQLEARIDGLQPEVGALSQRLARLEGAALGPWPARPPDTPEASPAS